ncbi:hypothetical protein PHLGIDRAFT_15569 [Phlebiopsis gigantea 11061_1 CR5-6]|uniref:Major facilitator superfamily (MFS) profile domain-containing protein n=1 Tax=Phlebiopsis gigantea (strain 11061_1 CR5-6) TaxID=745531 RepID=A0A0C3S2M6_PHLG1|nr:hypothetical protein PHLGIDRAFT_15569 [Phlebiopsis gigantea 11061_1 CR5-6]
MAREGGYYPDQGSREDSPLLASHDDESQVAPKTRVTPLPRAQFATICAIKLMVPVAHTQALPYVNKMIASFGLDARSVGYYSGLLSFASTAGQFLTIYAWGQVSDRVGRKPVIATGMLGLAASTLAFGASHSVASALAFRFLNGVFSGFIGVIHSVVGELSDKTNQSTAFPLYDIISALGFVVGPLIGGALAEPATRYYGWFDNAFLRANPYILPGIVTAVLAIGSTLLSLFVLRETHPRKRKHALTPPRTPPEPSRFESEPGDEIAPLLELEKPPGLRSLLSLPVIRALCAAQWMLGFIAAAFNIVFVLMAYTPIKDGGLSMNPIKIASALSIMGLVSIGLKATLPVFLRRFGVLTMFRFTLLTWPVTFALMPALNALARAGGGGDARPARLEAALWAAVCVVLFMSRLGTLAFSIVMIITKDHTPDALALGTTNSLSELFQMVGIAIGAPLVSSLFAFSISTHALGGYLWVVVICVLSLLGDYSASRIARHQ